MFCNNIFKHKKIERTGKMGKQKFNPHKNSRPTPMATAAQVREGVGSPPVRVGEVYAVSASSTSGSRFSGNAYISHIGGGRVVMIGMDGNHKICKVEAPVDDLTISPNGRDSGSRAQIDYFHRGTSEFNTYFPFAKQAR